MDETPAQRLRNAKREEALAKIREQLEDGTLTIRQATPAERAAWATRGTPARNPRPPEPADENHVQELDRDV